MTGRLREFGIVCTAKNCGIAKNRAAKTAEDIVLDGKNRKWEGRSGRGSTLNVFKEECLMVLVESFEFGEKVKMVFDKECTDHVDRVRDQVIIVMLP